MVTKKRKRRKRKSRYNRGSYTSTKTGQLCKHRSGWELSYMKWLDANDAVETWAYEKLVIEYVSNLKSKRVRRYFPDFHVMYADGHVEVVEIKPKRRSQQATVQKKARAAIEWCMMHNASYVMLTEIELKSMAIIC